MGEVVPALTSPTLLPPSSRTVLYSNYPVSKCPSASIVVTSTLRVNIPFHVFHVGRIKVTMLVDISVLYSVIHNAHIV